MNPLTMETSTWRMTMTMRLRAHYPTLSLATGLLNPYIFVTTGLMFAGSRSCRSKGKSLFGEPPVPLSSNLSWQASALDQELNRRQEERSTTPTHQGPEFIQNDNGLTY